MKIICGYVKLLKKVTVIFTYTPQLFLFFISQNFGNVIISRNKNHKIYQ